MKFYAAALSGLTAVYYHIAPGNALWGRRREIMKKRMTIVTVFLILCCLAVYFGYRTLDRIRTDTQAPEIILEDIYPEISVFDPASALLQGISARDNVDGDVTDSILVEKTALLDGTGRISVTYAAFDRAGNVAKVTREAKYTDYVGPRFTLRSPLIYSVGSNFDVLANVGVEDMVDGDIRHRVRATSLDLESVLEPGAHEVEFRVSNSLGDTSVLVLPVEVTEKVYTEAALTLKDYLIYIPQGGDFAPEEWLSRFICGDKATDLSGGLPAGYSLNTTGKVQTGVPGVYALYYQVTYSDKIQTEPVQYQQYTANSRLIVVVEG